MSHMLQFLQMEESLLELVLELGMEAWLAFVWLWQALLLSFSPSKLELGEGGRTRETILEFEWLN